MTKAVIHEDIENKLHTRHMMIDKHSQIIVNCEYEKIDIQGNTITAYRDGIDMKFFIK